MTWGQDMTNIVLPLATRVALPSWIGLSLGVMKDSALVFIVQVVELLKSTQILITHLQEPLFLLMICGLFYFVISFPVARFGGYLEKRWSNDSDRERPQVLRRAGGPQGDQPHGQRRGDPDGHRRVGVGQVDALTCINGLEPINSGRMPIDGTDVHAKATDLNKLRAQGRHRVPAVERLPASDGA